MEKLLRKFDPNYLKILSDSASASDFVSDTTFIALAAPSMEGKTQMAFVMKDVFPLYFPLSEAFQDSGNAAPQNIYLNFKDFSCMLRDCALEDMKENPTEAPLATDLLSILGEKPFWTAGFLKCLIETFQKLIPVDLDERKSFPWMKVFNERRSFTFSPESVAKIRSLTKCSDFFLFLDEFKAVPWAVFVRNLSRAIGLRCVVANTNTEVVNVVGKSSSSGSSGKMIWSFVACRLNGASKAILDSLYQFTDSIKKIVHRLEPELLAGASN